MFKKYSLYLDQIGWKCVKNIVKQDFIYKLRPKITVRWLRRSDVAQLVRALVSVQKTSVPSHDLAN